MDERLSDTRSKADFRLLRDMLGLPQAWVAQRVGVTPRTVRNWEDPKEFYPPSREAWDLVEGVWREAASQAAALVDIASQAAAVARERGVEPAPLMLTYWRDASQWLDAHPGHPDPSAWRTANAATRLASDRMHVLGLPVTIAFAETRP
ncbi:hypothetical protein BW14_06070 [Bifidobacterium sp. UTBIF-68]|uniref:helix-turn-helix domain-containing protein n=1 Tax=Bifidobacterium sp. UTBIF-68 TaxID=1465262 RepID=UPI00112B404B|nr:hypothetical protein [Bifidobacterium sp. UTBIF-68]TPF93240.1 hypothetical protein BW14_06070 [Bifidobacterium sp. UTBIF-68]